MTETHAENTPSDALTAWRKAFFTKDAKAFAEGFAENVVKARPAHRYVPWLLCRECERKDG